MAFKSVKAYNEERYGGMFLLRNDGDYADVIFLYRNEDEVLVADTHYIKSADYSGYVHCCGRRCPACEKGIRVQTKLFIPLYNINDNEIQFFDRSVRFESQIHSDVFSRCANPSEFVFRITRHGAAGDVNTSYSITLQAKNIYKSYDEIMAEFHTSMPEHYSTICKEMSYTEMSKILNSSDRVKEDISDLPAYQISPRDAKLPISGSGRASDPIPTPVPVDPRPAVPASMTAELNDASDDVDDVDF